MSLSPKDMDFIEATFVNSWHSDFGAALTLYQARRLQMAGTCLHPGR